MQQENVFENLRHSLSDIFEQLPEIKRESGKLEADVAETIVVQRFDDQAQLQPKQPANSYDAEIGFKVV
jgi:hypothetical protein